MRSFVERRSVRVCLVAMVSLVTAFLYTIAQGTLRPGGFTSGWTLLGFILFLALYNIRKLLPFLPLGSSAGWLQFHIYIAMLSFLVFAIHMRFSVPNGIFECSLAITYLAVFVSGVIGLYISRTYPKRLTDLGNEIIFEHIPVARRQLRDDIEALVTTCGESASTSSVPEFYQTSLRPFVLRHYDVFSHLVRGSSRRWRRLRRNIADQNRYLDDHERTVLAQVETLLQRKHQLDTQYALQAALRMWLLFHIPATYSLLILAVFHAVLVHAWSGGAM